MGALGGCAGADNAADTQGVGNNVANGHGVFENIRARHEPASRAGGLYASLVEAMPQVRYVIDGGEPISIADAYVVGEFVSAEAGKSFRWSTDGDVEVRHELEYNATDAQASSVHVTLAIERSIVDPNQPEAVHRSLDPGNKVTFGLAFNAPVILEAVTAEFQTTPTLVALLYDSSPVYDYEEGLWAVLEDGAFLGQASDDSAYFPALDSGDANGAEAAPFSFAELEAPPPSEPIAVSSEAAGGD
ncbi:MAG: hypothetical protein H0V96_03260 [Acidimicrobiia bacterium]|nr:hypothetical protein [Acidimicrobiia bacterium]